MKKIFISLFVFSLFGCAEKYTPDSGATANVIILTPKTNVKWQGLNIGVDHTSYFINTKFDGKGCASNKHAKHIATNKANANVRLPANRNIMLLARGDIGKKQCSAGVTTRLKPNRSYLVQFTLNKEKAFLEKYYCNLVVKSRNEKAVYATKMKRVSGLSLNERYCKI